MQWIQSKEVSFPCIYGHYATHQLTGVLCCGCYNAPQGQTLWIRELAVHPNHQQQGIARKLMNKALHQGRLQGAQRAFLAVDEDNGPAIQLYQSFGFQPSISESELNMIRYAK